MFKAFVSLLSGHASYFPFILLRTFLLSLTLYKTSIKTNKVLSSEKPKFTHKSARNIDLGTERGV